MRLDTGFRPSRHGFGFANTWHDTLLGIVDSRGRCGGMVFAALDAYAEGVPLEGADARELPAYDAPLARAIWRRQYDSVVTHAGANLLQFARFTYLPTASAPGVGPATRRELLPLFDALRSGRPVPLGLVSGISLPQLARNHQVLAYAADFDEGVVTIHVYDPNLPRRDDVTLVVRIDPHAPVVEHTGMGGRTKDWRGMFVELYRPRLTRAVEAH